jgi:exoribonuclease II
MSFHAGAFYSNYIEMFPRTISSNLCSLKQSKYQISLIGNAVCVPQVQMVWNELINQSIKQINLSQSIQNNMNYVNNDFSQLNTLNGFFNSRYNYFIKLPQFKSDIIHPSDVVAT